MKKTGYIIMLCFFLVWNLTFAQESSDYKQEIEKAQKDNDTISLTRAWYGLAKYYDHEQQLEKSNDALRIALYWAESNKNYNAYSSVANYLASNFSITGENDSAVYYYKLAIQACIENSDSTKLAGVLINLGDQYASTGNYIEAANHALLAIQIKESVKDSSNLAYFYQKLGEVYKTAGEIDKWEEYIQKAYQLIKNKNQANSYAIAAIYNDLGGIAEQHNNYNQALLYYDTLIAFGKENDYNNAVGVALSNSATIYKLQGNHKKALESAIEARNYKTASTYQTIYDNNLLAELYLENGNLIKAQEFAEIAINDPYLDNSPDEKIRTLKILYLIEKQNGNYKKALEWNEKFKSLSDSIRNKDIRTKIVDLEMAYETEKKETQIELLTTENQLKKQKIKAGIIILSILTVLIVLILYVLLIRRKQATLIQNDLQQQVLRAQMNPHFIFNVLGSIQNFMMQNDTRKASNFLSQFASLTRATLKNSAAETISLADEISMLRNYIELEKMRKGNKFDYEIIFDDDLETDFIQIPPMLIQPFIENSIKHGFKDIESGGFLSLNITDKTDWIEFIIEDNGSGIQQKKETDKKHQSMAMSIFEKRRKLIQHKHKKIFKYEIINISETNSKKSGVKIILNTPILNIS